MELIKEETKASRCQSRATSKAVKEETVRANANANASNGKRDQPVSFRPINDHEALQLATS
jgi:hypothetical protein